MSRREYNKVMEKEENKNEKGGAKKRWLAFFDYFKIIFNLIFLQLV